MDSKKATAQQVLSPEGQRGWVLDRARLTELLEGCEREGRKFVPLHPCELRALLATPTAPEPAGVVAWEYRISLPDLKGPWQECTKAWALEAKAHGCETRPLYTHPAPQVDEAMVP